MGAVFHARDTRLERDVALKFLTGIGPLGPEVAERLRLEARSLAALKHANIVTIYDIDETDGAPFLVLEWVQGTALGRAVLPSPLGEDAFLRVALPIAEALAAAHSRGIVHRDLKPDNVILADDGVVKLVDFGLAKLRDTQVQLTKTGHVAGTATYMSPEQATGEEVGPASDVFSFGVMAYEMLAGRRPFAGEYASSLLYAVVNTPHAPLATHRPDLSASLISLVERCLQKDPRARYAGGAELALDLNAVARSLNTGAAPRVVQPPVPGGGREIRYCRTADGASIAYSVHGSGPVIVRVLGWFTHLEMELEWPALCLIWDRLAETHTVVRYDGRGIGLSSPWSEEFTDETRESDLEAVLDAVGAPKVTLYAISEGGWTGAHYAARHPERISHLVIYGSYARGITHRPGFDPEETRALEVLMRKGWGRDTPQYRQIFTTAYFGADADPGLVAHFNRMQRAAADSDTAARYQESLHRRGDATGLFATIRTPTLVIHCRDDQIVPFDEGRLIASVIPGAQFLPLAGGEHYFPIDEEVTRKITEAINRFTL